MKHSILFALPLSLLTLGANINPDDFIFPGGGGGYINPISTETLALDPIGSCDEYGTDINLTGYVSSKMGISGVKERLSVATSGSAYSYFYTSAKHDVGKNKKVNFSLPLPIHSMLSRNGIDCKVELLTTTGEVLKEYTFTLKPSSYSRILVRDYLISPRINYDVVLDPDRYSSTREEKIYFDDFFDYFNEDNYYRLNLNRISISYSCVKEFPGCNAYLHFVDYNRVFPYLDNNDQNPSFDIPLRYVVNDSKISFDFPEQMYVNPKTLEMSLNAKAGYRLTKYFYLPINKKNLLIDETFALKVSSFGYDKLSFDWNITYTNDRNLLGDCNNSDYCIVGEME